MSNYSPQLKKFLIKAGCHFYRQGKGDHEIWSSPITHIKFVVDNAIKSKHTANAVLKQAGLPKQFREGREARGEGIGVGKGFKDLKVWQSAMTLVLDIYRITNQGRFKSDFGLRDQARRCAVSVPSNIAEGDERDTDKDSIRFFYIAKGSLAELRTQLEIAYRVGYIDQEEYESIESQAIKIGKMLGALIKARSDHP